MMLAKLVAGACALFLGRRLFWLFVGVVGFAVGIDVATHVFAGASHLVVLTVAVAAGLAGAFLATAAQRLMIGVVGFVAGSYLGNLLLTTWMPYPGRNVWFAVFAGGVVGAWLLTALFDWALIVLSSLVGAGFILQAYDLRPDVTPVVYAVLVTVGIVVQASLSRRRRPPRRT